MRFLECKIVTFINSKTTGVLLAKYTEFSISFDYPLKVLLA